MAPLSLSREPGLTLDSARFELFPDHINRLPIETFA
jgi:hypothetical protein